jgi:spermidine synthase
VAALFVPATIFGMVSPLVITLLSANQPGSHVSKIVGNVYALGTLGSVSGAVAGAFYLIPWVGLSTSLRLFAVLLTIFSIYWSVRYYRLGAAAAVAICLIVPQPNYAWSDPATLLTQREGYYDTIRVYTDGSTFVRLHLGPTYESEMSLQTYEPTFEYAKTMIELVSHPANQKVLVIGGAGHTIARALEMRGAIVTEVEIDPIVVAVSDDYFGPIRGDVVVQDGRTYIDNFAGQGFAYVLIDAFNGLYSVPPHLTTLEFFESVSRILTPEGRMLYNFIGAPSGSRSNSFRALSTTISAAFGDTRTSSLLGDAEQNVLFIASRTEMLDTAWADAPTDGVLLTDDLNPIEIFFQQARTSVEFHR